MKRAFRLWCAIAVVAGTVLTACISDEERFLLQLFGLSTLQGEATLSGQIRWQVTTGGCSVGNLGGGTTGVGCSFISPSGSKNSSIQLRDVPPGNTFDAVFGAILMQLPASVSNVRGSYSGAASGTLTVRSAGGSVWADSANAVVAEPNMAIWVIEPPPSAGTYTLVVDFNEAGTAAIPMPMKVIFTEKVDANGRSNYPPFFPCAAGFAEVTALSLPLAPTPTSISFTPLLAQNGCSNKLYSFGPTVQVVEFYNQALDHYFITWMGNEIALLDAGTTIKGWARTGQSFKAYVTAQTGTTNVCRIYIIPVRGDSHFFGRGQKECNDTMTAHPDFVLEDPAFMAMILPVAGVCPTGTTNVYRVFSNRPDANHRYMTSTAIRAQMVTKGWVVEGDGPDAVVMCAPA